jgi:hypothetical protein
VEYDESQNILKAKKNRQTYFQQHQTKLDIQDILPTVCFEPP